MFVMALIQGANLTKNLFKFYHLIIASLILDTFEIAMTSKKS
jgi:hypothetical protein